MDIKTIEKKIREEASKYLLRTALFLVYYIFLILLGLGMFITAFRVTCWMLASFTNADSLDLRVMLIGLFALLAMWWFCIQIAWYLIKPLFQIHKNVDNNRVEINRSECPELFSMIEEVAKATGNKMPKHVYLTSETNASVFYNSTSFWAIFLPTRKNLKIGLGLLNGMNKSEIKAILSHEFGHFSQKTMRIAAISYRLSLIIGDIIEQDQKQQEQMALIRAIDDNDDTVSYLFHLASIPISVITRITFSFYKYIEGKYRSLSRLMEFEADAVACRVVGKKAFISSLLKVGIASYRYDQYEALISILLLSEKKMLKEFWKGYSFAENIIASNENVIIGHDNMLENLIGDDAKFESKISFPDGWDTHPSLRERIDNVRQFADVPVIDLSDATTLVNDDIQDLVGERRQEIIVENMNDVIRWHEIEHIEFEDFKLWAKKQLDENLTPHFLYPFIQKKITSFNIPNEEELSRLPIESPFTEENRDMLLEYSNAMQDWETLNDLSEYDDWHITYDGRTYDNAKAVIDMHRTYLNSFADKLAELDIQMFCYLWQTASNKQQIKNIYWNLFYSIDNLNGIRNIQSTTEKITEQIKIYYSHGKKFSLREEVFDSLVNEFWQFMRGFDYEYVNNAVGTWTKGEKTVCQMLDEWNDFASQESVPDILVKDLLEMINNVYQLLVEMYKSAKGERDERIEMVVYHLEELKNEPDDEDSVTDNVWDESLEFISNNEKIRYAIVERINALPSTDKIVVANIFGNNPSIDEYTEFVKVTNKSLWEKCFGHFNELNEALASDGDEDSYIMKRIAYTYLEGTIVIHDYVESTKWFIKASEFGDAEALSKVGEAYMHGIGIEKDIPKALEYYKRAIVADGYDEALLHLGLCYIHGCGVPRDFNHGATLMIRAALQGNRAAQYNMGYLYREGFGVEKNIEESHRWYELYANNGI